MLSYVLILTIVIEIIFILLLIKVIFMLTTYNSMIPGIKNAILTEMRTIKENFETLNRKIETNKVKPLKPSEVGQLFSGVIMRLILKKKLSLLDIITSFIKHRKRLFALILSYYKPN